MSDPIAGRLRQPAVRLRELLCRNRLGLGAAFLVLALVLGCSGAESPAPVPAATASSAPVTAVESSTPAQPTAAPANTVAAPADAPAESPAPTETAAPERTAPEPTAPPAESVGVGGQTYVIQSGATARYLVREQLARLDLPNDAVGVTNDVTGAIVFDADGGVVAPDSMIVVDLQGLTSDSDRRDGYVRSRSLETDAYPTAEFLIQETAGLPWPLPTEGEAAFQIMGDLTLHGVTKPSTWDVAGQFDGDSFNGTAKTNFTFEEFGIAIPRVRVVLSVDNDIRLELDFTASAS